MGGRSKHPPKSNGGQGHDFTIGISRAMGGFRNWEQCILCGREHGAGQLQGGGGNALSLEKASVFKYFQR